MRTRAILFGVLLGLLALPAGILAQAVSGTVKGVAADSSGAVIPAATCILTNESTNSSVIENTFSDGAFTFSNVMPGNYSLKIDARVSSL